VTLVANFTIFWRLCGPRGSFGEAAPGEATVHRDIGSGREVRTHGSSFGARATSILPRAQSRPLRPWPVESPRVQTEAAPGIHLTKLHFGRKFFRATFLLGMADKITSKNCRQNNYRTVIDQIVCLKETKRQ
jgi:hypothetical protein